MMTGSYSRMRTSLKTALNVPNVQSYDAHLLVVHIIFFVILFSYFHACFLNFIVLSDCNSNAHLLVLSDCNSYLFIYLFLFIYFVTFNFIEQKCMHIDHGFLKEYN